MSTRAPTPSRAAWREIVVLGGVAAAWLMLWVVLTLAAAAAGGHPHLNPVQLLDPVAIAARIRARQFPLIWRLIGAGADTNAAIFFVVLCGVLLLLGAAAVTTVLLARGGSPSSILPWRARVMAVSRWARGRDLRRLRARRATPGRFVIGSTGRHLLATERETSTLIVGPTRSGKTTSLVVPNLLEWHGPAIVTSTKNELLEITAAHRQTLGPVHVYDPTGELADSGYQTVTWSPLIGCQDLDRAWMVAAWLCAGLQQGSSRGDNDWIHWAESGKLLIAPLLFAAACSGRTIVDVHAWIHGFDLVTPMTLLEDLEADASHPSAHDAARAVSMMTAIDQRPERERGTVFSTVMRIFNVFNERAVAGSAATSRFEPRAFLERRGTLYLCTPRLAPERIASLFVGILMTVVTEAYLVAERSPRGRLAHELGLFLDELANVIPIDELPSLASQGAGRGVLLMSIVQDISQLRARYGNDRAHSILNNHACKVVLPGVSDPETVDLMSRLLGRSSFTDVQVSRGGDGKISRSYSVRHDSLASPDALRQLDALSAVVLYRGRPPILARLQPWYRNKRYVAMAQRKYFRLADHVRPLA
ncbi:MAG: type IV secretory system conjugative DNA transfer family protein [Candidatus Dormibacteraeota bacterium]|nr:type IV secretory system conjugative DNA transfer family protein [Candidatus Dormibacteraeota bacterium]